MSKIIFALLSKVMMILFFCILFASSAFASQPDWLYFDEDGNMVYSGYDKIATSGIRYKTIGWVIKRYEEPIDSVGQYSINVKCSGLEYSVIDPQNPDYVYTTFIVDGNAILERIGEISPEWKHQLVAYGREVYIDSIITIIEYGEEMGSISEDGVLSGEVYNTYEGIRNARGWADPDVLSSHYDMLVFYPYKANQLQLEIKDTDSAETKLQSTTASSFVLQAGTKDEKTFDISEGVPSGENLYLYGTTDTYQYEIVYEEITGYANVPVKVYHQNALSWKTDEAYHTWYYSHEVWYHVKREYQYTKIKSVTLWKLSGVEIFSGCLEAFSESIEVEDLSCEWNSYEDTINRLEIQQVSDYISTPFANIESENGHCPDIPEQNYQDLAEENVGELKIKSDYLELEGTVILSDEKQEKKGAVIGTVGDFSKTELDMEGLLIPKNVLNQENYETEIHLIYTDGTNEMVIVNQNIDTITVHTPVVAEAYLVSEKDWNENITPTISDVVIGSSFSVGFQTDGQHRDILGYGNRNYAEYVEKSYICFPFPVKYVDNLYEADSWIALDGFVHTFYIPDHVPEGNYQAKICVTAYNIPEFSPETISDYEEEGANLELAHYAATAILEIEVIGRLYGFTLENNQEKRAIGAEAVFPEPLEILEEYLPLSLLKIEAEDESFCFSLYASGIGDEEGEAVEMDFSYYVSDANGGRKEVDVYYAEDEKFTGETLSRMPENFILQAQEAEIVKDGIYRYSKELSISNKLVIVPKGLDITNLTIFSSEIIWNQLLIVNVDIYASENGIHKLSYENAENEPEGYCNMWKTEGFDLSVSEPVQRQYGDILLLGTERLAYPVFEIIGTH